MPRPQTRIPAERLTFAHESLFGRSVFTGAAMAREMGIKDVTLWSWFSRRGLTPADAGRAADVLTEWAMRLLAVSVRLRRLAREVEAASEAAPDA